MWQQHGIGENFLILIVLFSRNPHLDFFFFFLGFAQCTQCSPIKGQENHMTSDFPAQTPPRSRWVGRLRWRWHKRWHCASHWRGKNHLVSCTRLIRSFRIRDHVLTLYLPRYSVVALQRCQRAQIMKNNRSQTVEFLFFSSRPSGVALERDE